MWEKLVLFLVFLVWSLAVTPLSIFLSRQYGIVDEPGGRKRHPTTTPRGAGVVIWVGYLLYAILGSSNPVLPRSMSLVYFFYREGFVSNDKGYAAAIAMVIFLIIGIVTAVQFRLQKRWVQGD